MVTDLCKVEGHATLTDVANRLSTWLVRIGNNAAAAAATAALVGHPRSEEADARFGRMLKVVIVAAK